MADTEDTGFDRGHVIWHDGLFRSNGRPWLVLSDSQHPFHGREYLVAGITTTEREDVISLPDAAWRVGDLPRTSYVSPWFLTTLKHRGIDRGIGALTTRTVETVVEAVARYLGCNSD